MEMMESGNKRCRDEPDESPEVEAKRHRVDLLFDILEDDAGYCDAADGDIATVINSLEEEIGLAPRPPPQPASDLEGESCQQDLDYLLAASDDELGLPPAEPSPSTSVEEVGLPAADASPSSSYSGGYVAGSVVDELETAGFGQIWGLDNEIWGFYGGDAGFGISPEDDLGDVYYTDGLFVHPPFSHLL